MLDIYGIKNCNTVKKALDWLDAHNIAYTFHDYKKEGVDEKKLKAWVKELGWETLLNRQGTTWRKLPDDIKEGINHSKALQLMIENPSIIKRPLIDNGKQRIVGMDETVYERYFAE